MATYKVPQDVEADDKLLGPFTFRQFVYLMIIFGLVMLAIALYQIYPILAIIPVPFILFLAILALPIKKDQPMEAYVSALISYYTKPNKRFFVPGLSNSTIAITTPKKVEAPRARNISGDEASHRLSFLSEIIDSEGHAIKNTSSPLKDEFYAEAYNTRDMFERGDGFTLNNALTKQKQEQHNAMVDQMRAAIQESEYNTENKAVHTNLPGERVLQPRSGFVGTSQDFSPSGAPSTLSGFESPAVVQPSTPQPINSAPVQNSSMTQESTSAPLGIYGNAASAQPALDESFMEKRARELQAEADRIRKENESEVFISLH